MHHHVKMLRYFHIQLRTESIILSNAYEYFYGSSINSYLLSPSHFAVVENIITIVSQIFEGTSGLDAFWEFLKVIVDFEKVFNERTPGNMHEVDSCRAVSAETRRGR